MFTPQTQPQLAQILDGKKLAEKIKRQIRDQVKTLEPKPGLAAILVGQDAASKLYVNLKKKACEFVDIDFCLYEFEDNCTEQELIEAIKFLNQDPQINGILVQLPLPKHLDTDKIISAVDPAKDADGFHPENLNALKQGTPRILSPLVLGVQELIKETKTPIQDKIITIVANHEIFAEPFKFLYGQSNKIFITNPTDELCQEKCHQADILIVAIGQPKFINNKYIKKNAIIIDVGISKLNDQTVGDVDFENVVLKAKYVTPVPGGVGPMTVTMLLENVVKLYQQQQHQV
jgi:methylenetetrahydrofolate dehydrogenase (NADP+)/methenyltetrahydrofolate cyclohydrolase